MRILQICGTVAAVRRMNGLFTHYISTRDCHLKYARGEPSVLGEEFHDYDELVLFLEGTAQLVSEEIQLQLTPGSLILIPREHFHRFRVAEPAGYCRCILGFRETPALRSLIRAVMTEVTVLPQPSGAVRFLFDRLLWAIREEKLPQAEQVLLLQAVLVQLLLELRLSQGEGIQKNVTVSPLTRQVLQYIDANLAEDLRLETLAQRLNVSVSTLSHRFRKELNISVHRYISEKRLSAARKLVQAGMTLGAAAAASGFRDYAGFYRMYRLSCGENPSALRKEQNR